MAIHIEIGTLVVSIPAGMMTMPQSGYPLSRNIPDTQPGKRLHSHGQKNTVCNK